MGFIKDMDSDSIDAIYSMSPVGLTVATYSASNPSYIKCLM